MRESRESRGGNGAASGLNWPLKFRLKRTVLKFRNVYKVYLIQSSDVKITIMTSNSNTSFLKLTEQ